MSWTGDLTPGASAVITYSVTVDNPDTGDLTLTNTVTSATPGSNCPAGGTDPRCTVTLTVVNAATLTITSTAGAPSTVAGAVVSYTVTIANSGLTPYDDASVTDPLTGVLDDAAYDSDAAAVITGTTTPAGTVTYSSPTLTWTGTVPATGSVTLTYTVTVDNPDTGSQILASTVTSASPDSNCPAGSTDPRCTTTVTVSALAITFATNVTTTTPGGIVRITATLANTGQTPYLGITVTFNAAGIADDATGNGDQTATSGTLAVGATGGSWTGDIPVGGTVTITSTVTVDNPDTGDHLLTGTAVTTAPGSNCPAGSTDPACTAVTTVLTPALSIITTTTGTPAAVPGQTITYTLTIADTGQTTYTGAVVTESFAQMLDDAAYDGDATITTGTGALSYTSPVLTWTGTLAPGTSAVITYTITVNDPDTGDKQVITTAASTATGSTCPPGTTTSPCQLTLPVLTPALTITTAATPAAATPGAVVTYTLTITDTGQTPYTAASVTDPLTDVLDDAAYNSDAHATAGTVTFTSPALTWTGTLSPGGAAVITFTVTVHNPDTDNHILTSTITSTTAGSNCPAGGTDPRCTTTAPTSRPDHRQHRQRQHRHPRLTLTYTAHHHQHRADPLLPDPRQHRHAGRLADDTTASATTRPLPPGPCQRHHPDLSWTGTLAPSAARVSHHLHRHRRQPRHRRQDPDRTPTSAAPGTTARPGSTDPRCTSTVTRACSPPWPSPRPRTRPWRSRGRRWATPSPSPTPGRPPTPRRRSASRWPGCWATPPTTATRPRPPGRSPMPARS